MSIEVGIVLPNYNSPEEADAIVEYLRNKITVSYRLELIDNGSDTAPPSKYSTCILKKNRNKLGGVLTGMCLVSRYDPKYYWILSTSMKMGEFNGDPLVELISQLNSVEDSVGILPGFVGNLIHYPHKTMAADPNSRLGYHLTTFGLGAFAMYRAEWLDEIGWFDPCLTSSWGVDYEMGHLCEIKKKKLVISDTFTTTIDDSGKTYYADSLGKYHEECRDEMYRVFQRKYGDNWKEILNFND